MSHSNRLIAIAALLLSSHAQAFELFGDFLYWQASEVVDWVYINSLELPNQTISYRSLDYDTEPSFRVGMGYDICAWESELYYTRFYSNTRDVASGNLVSGFLGITVARPFVGYFFQDGVAYSSLDFNVFDLNFSKPFAVNDNLWLKPLIGLKAGWIDQAIYTSLAGTPLSASESITHNFKGIGPKVGLNSAYGLLDVAHGRLNFILDFASSFMWGNWNIHDVTQDTSPENIIIQVHSRNSGALVFEGSLGFAFDYECFNVKLVYELQDWFNQCQVFDDVTGGHNNDLLLQGLTLGFNYRF